MREFKEFLKDSQTKYSTGWPRSAKSEYVGNLAVGELNERKNDGRQ